MNEAARTGFGDSGGHFIGSGGRRFAFGVVGAADALGHLPAGQGSAARNAVPVGLEHPCYEFFHSFAFGVRRRRWLSRVDKRG